MNNKIKYLALAGLLSLIFLAVGCRQGAYQPKSSTPAVSSSVTHDVSPNTASNEEALNELILQGQKLQKNESNNVTIEAVPQSKLTVGSRELVFNITMDTHSVNLDVYDLTTLATLRNSQGRQFKATSWQAPKGGHHRSGTLGFRDDQSILQQDTKYIELLIKDVANVPERVMRWELRLVGS